MALVQKNLWPDGEQIPDDYIRNIFRPPPGAPPAFHRSSLVIGARGAGKTTLFRYHKEEVHSGIALHINLVTVLDSITKETSQGILAFQIAKNLELPIIGKSISLLALNIVDRLFKKGISPPKGPFFDCLPKQFLENSKKFNLKWIDNVKRKVANYSVYLFNELPGISPLSYCISSLGESCLNMGKPLLLLLDRADMVIASSLIPLFDLLDQSSQYIALLAMRPCPAGETIANITNVVAGDHYDVIHLGQNPRSSDWVNFVESAVKAQLPNYESIPHDIKKLVISISRDSIRTALELFARYPSTNDASARDKLLNAIEDLRDNQILGAQKTLQNYHPDFHRMIREIREEAIRINGKITGPLYLNFDQNTQRSFFESKSKLSRFVQLALRSGSFCMPEGKRWIPGQYLSKVEITPLLCWEKGYDFWVIDSAAPTIITRKENEIFRSSGGPKKATKIFVAYRMDFPESRNFKMNLENKIKEHHNQDLSQLEIIDGGVPAGTNWPIAIRDRIKKSKVVIGDVTGMRSDVIFELGFAYGLNKVIIPVVSEKSHIPILPKWLGATQVGTFGDNAGMSSLLIDIVAQLSDTETLRIPRPPKPVPGLAVWLRCLSWNEHAIKQFESTARKEGLKSEIIMDGLPDGKVLNRAVSATLLVVCFDGTESDTFMHYICGAAASKPKDGSGTLLKRILILEEPNCKKGTLIAESLKRCQDFVQIIQLNQVIDGTIKFAQYYRS